ncbi:ras-induced vulval development antagonist-domain-containing protein [Lactifluus volemus]|nr:ras-induced vulval development antagonist-domain-containing protein [Lactifluus volemus]
MAFVHPSRMAFVPREPGAIRSSTLPSKLSGTNQGWSRDDERNNDRGREDRSGRSRDYGRRYLDRDDDGRRQGRGVSSERDSDHERDRRRSRERGNLDSFDDHRERNAGDSGPRGTRSQRDGHSTARSPGPASRSANGRASPRYDDYSRSRQNSTPPRDSNHGVSGPRPSSSPLPHDNRSTLPEAPENSHPWRQQENMYRRDGRFDGGGDYFERRRQQRAKSTFSIWPPSPRARARELSLERDLDSHKKHKRHHSPSTSVSSTDGEEDRKRRERRERKRARKEKENRERRQRRSPTRSDDEARERHRRKSKNSRSTSLEPHKTRSRTRSPRREQSSEEDAWVEKPAPSGSFVPAVPTTVALPHIPSPSASRAAQKQAVDGDTSDEEVGPQPAAPATTKKLDERAYGGALLRGEGSAMAAFLQEGTDFESVGYVMSGSRHRRMNAVRMRKENQVISAEEKRGILKLQQEEKQRREAILREEFQELLTDRLKGAEGTKAS